VEREPGWVAPVLWRSEMRDVLTDYLRKRLLTFDQAYAIQTEAEALLADREYTRFLGGVAAHGSQRVYRW
jgi:hypothetical protein